MEGHRQVLSRMRKTKGVGGPYASIVKKGTTWIGCAHVHACVFPCYVATLWILSPFIEISGGKESVLFVVVQLIGDTNHWLCAKHGIAYSCRFDFFFFWSRSVREDPHPLG